MLTITKNPHGPAAGGGNADCFGDDELTALFEAQLDATRRGALIAHLETCDECRRLVAEYARASPLSSASAAASAAAAAVAGVVVAGVEIGRYRVVRPLGAGAMGAVYEAHDPELDRVVALKLLHAAGPGVGAISDDQMRLEARAMARVAHPNVVPVFDVGNWAGRTFLAMELVEGAETLSAWLRRARPGSRAVLAAFQQAGAALAAAHRVGVVHRDFKPDNVLLGPDGRVRVVDFGLASVTSGSPSGGKVGWPNGNDVFAGTPAYMAPEQLRGERADARSDQFSFCVTFYEAIYGVRPPGRGAARGPQRAQAPRLQAQDVFGRVRPPTRGAFGRVPRGLRRALERGLAVDPAARFPSMGVLLGELARLEPGVRRGVLALVGALVLAFGALGYGAGAARREGARLEAACGGAERLEGEIWGASVQRAARAALGEGAAAELAWSLLQGALGRYAHDWAVMRQRACLADAFSHHPNRFAAAECLDRRRFEFDALVRGLSGASTGKRAEAAYLLSDLRGCENTRVLAVGAAGPGEAARLEALRRALAEAHAAFALGRYGDAKSLAERARDAARALGSRYFEAEALGTLGLTALDAGAFNEAERHLVDAYQGADAVGHDHRRAWLAAPLIILFGCIRHAPAEGRRWLASGRAALERLGEDQLLEGHLTSAEGSLLACEGRGRDALATFDRALALLERERGSEPSVVRTLLNVAVERHNLGDYDTGPQLERAMRLAQAAFGPAHRLSARASWLWGDAAQARGFYRQARAHYEVARQRLEASLGHDNRETLLVKGNVCIMDAYAGALAAALRCQQEALADAEGALGPDADATADVRGQLGVLLVELGRAREAEPLLRRSLETLRARRGAEDPTLGLVHLGLGAALRARGKARAALAELTRAEALFAKFDPGVLDRAALQFELARALVTVEPARARRLAASAGELYRSIGNDGLPARVAEVDAWLARHPASPPRRPPPRR